MTDNQSAARAGQEHAGAGACWWPSAAVVSDMNHIEMEARRFNENLYLWAKVDGADEFWIRAEWASESFANSGPPTSEVFAQFRDLPSTRVVRDGECEESCCPSLFADVIVENDRVRWENLRYSYPGLEEDEALWATRAYEFSRADYETLAAKALADAATQLDTARGHPLGGFPLGEHGGKRE